MPQATTLRLVRGSCEARPRAAGSASALTMVQQHATHMRRIHTIASSMAADADILVEANEIAHNNWAGFAPGWEAGGSKWVALKAPDAVSTSRSPNRTCAHSTISAGVTGCAPP